MRKDKKKLKGKGRRERGGEETKVGGKQKQSRAIITPIDSWEGGE